MSCSNAEEDRHAWPAAARDHEGELGTLDTWRDPRGFAIKMYTEEGNYDLVGNNTPIFFVRDPQKFQDFIHSQKRHPVTNLRDHKSTRRSFSGRENGMSRP